MLTIEEVSNNNSRGRRYYSMLMEDKIKHLNKGVEDCGKANRLYHTINAISYEVAQEEPCMETLSRLNSCLSAIIGECTPRTDVVYYTWLDTKQVPTYEQILGMTQLPIIKGLNYTIPFNTNTAFKYLCFAEISDNAVKTKWEDTSNIYNKGGIGTASDLFDTVSSVGIFRVYLTAYKTKSVAPFFFKQVGTPTIQCSEDVGSFGWAANTWTCEVNNGINTGIRTVLTLKEINTLTGLATGLTKPNLVGVPDYIPPHSSIECATEYWNTVQQSTFNKNDCLTGQVGTAVTYTVPAGTFKGNTQTAANTLALNKIQTEGQIYANNNGTCIQTTFASIAMTKTVRRNNCGTDFQGSEVTTTIPVGQFTANTQTEANQLAQNYLNTQAQINANAQGTCTRVLFRNTEQSASVARNNCAIDLQGSTVTYTVPAGTYSSTISQTAANQLALDDISQNSQAYANANGTCTRVTFWNVAKSGSFARNNCAVGYAGSSVTYTVAAHTYSASSQSAADALADADVTANGQAYANANGTCTLIPSYYLNTYIDWDGKTYIKLQDENKVDVVATASIGFNASFVFTGANVGDPNLTWQSSANILSGASQHGPIQFGSAVYISSAFTFITPSLLNGHRIVEGTVTVSPTYVWGKIFEEDTVVTVGGAAYARFILRTYANGSATVPPTLPASAYPCTNASIGVGYYVSDADSANSFQVSMNKETSKLLYAPGNISHNGDAMLQFCPGCGVEGADLTLWVQFDGKTKGEWKLLQTDTRIYTNTNTNTNTGGGGGTGGGGTGTGTEEQIM